MHQHWGDKFVKQWLGAYSSIDELLVSIHSSDLAESISCRGILVFSKASLFSNLVLHWEGRSKDFGQGDTTQRSPNDHWKKYLFLYLESIQIVGDLVLSETREMISPLSDLPLEIVEWSISNERILLSVGNETSESYPISGTLLRVQFDRSAPLSRQNVRHNHAIVASKRGNWLL